jgi:hypothetical protein
MDGRFWTTGSSWRARSALNHNEAAIHDGSQK